MANDRPNRMRATPVRELLTGSPAVRHALELQRREDALLTRVRDLLAPGARPHCLQATIKDGALTVTVDSAAWATRLRYLAPDLVQGLGTTGVIAAKIRARPVDRQPIRQTAQRVPRLTAAVVEHLITAADHVSDAGIAEVLRRLAARARAEMAEPPERERCD
jgi:hypothetical protein